MTTQKSLRIDSDKESLPEETEEKECREDDRMGCRGRQPEYGSVGGMPEA